MLTDALARDQNNALVTDAFRPQSSDSFASVSRIIMAERIHTGKFVCYAKYLWRNRSAVAPNFGVFH